MYEKKNKDQRDRLRAAQVSLIASFFIMACKFVAFQVSGSQAIFSDAAESGVNVVAAMLALIVVALAFKPADTKHPYGHGKMEFFSAAFEGGLITFAAIAILIQAIMALIHGNSVEDLGFGLVLIGVGGLSNLLLGLYLKKVGTKAQSKALLASSAHVLSDLWTSVGIIVGLCLYLLTGWLWIDSCIALIVALFLIYSGVNIVKEAFRDLLDGTDNGLVESLAAHVEKYRLPGMIQIHRARILRSGNFHHIDAHLIVPQFWDVEKAHEKTEKFTKRMMEKYPYDGEVCFHVEPCRKAYCTSCECSRCPIRQAEFVERSFLMEEFVALSEPSKKKL